MARASEAIDKCVRLIQEVFIRAGQNVEDSVWPSIQTTTILVPLPKVANAATPQQYRPIVIGSHLAKVTATRTTS